MNEHDSVRVALRLRPRPPANTAHHINSFKFPWRLPRSSGFITDHDGCTYGAITNPEGVLQFVKPGVLQFVKPGVLRFVKPW